MQTEPTSLKTYSVQTTQIHTSAKTTCLEPSNYSSERGCFLYEYFIWFYYYYFNGVYFIKPFLVLGKKKI